RNIISGNSSYGIWIANCGSPGVIVQGNFIGADLTGTTTMGNGAYGVLVGGDGCQVGGPEPAHGNLGGGNGRYAGLRHYRTNNLVQGNTVHDNLGSGIEIGVNALGQGNTLTQNSIYHNGGGNYAKGLGIDILRDASDAGGVNPNDPLDADTGPNG